MRKINTNTQLLWGMNASENSKKDFPLIIMVQDDNGNEMHHVLSRDELLELHDSIEYIFDLFNTASSTKSAGM